MGYTTKNYEKGDEWVVGGKLTIEEGAVVEGLGTDIPTIEPTVTFDPQYPDMSVLTFTEDEYNTMKESPEFILHLAGEGVIEFTSRFQLDEVKPASGSYPEWLIAHSLIYNFSRGEALFNGLAVTMQEGAYIGSLETFGLAKKTE